MTPEQNDIYKAAIVEMVVRKDEWLKKNHGREILVSFPPCSKGHGIIGRLSDGIEKGVVRCNPAGKELLEYMAGDLHPTIVMAYVAFTA